MAFTYVAPPDNLIYDLRSKITIEFTDTTEGTVSIVLSDLGDKNKTFEVPLEKNGNNYKAVLSLPKGRYEYYFTNSSVTNVTTPSNYRFRVGYVFVIVGHSLASDNGEKWCADNRVAIVDGYQAKVDSDWKNEAKYVGQSYVTPSSIWATKSALPVADQYPYTIGPWSRMAELIATRDDIDVAIVNTAMGGSSVQMWADEAVARPFLHGFASPDPNVPTYNLYNSGIPYFHFQNVLKHIVKNTGVTAVLVQHGENDMLKDPLVVGTFYKELIEKARNDSGMTGLPFVIAKSAWLEGSQPQITAVEVNKTLASVDEALRITNFTYLGPDTHAFPQSLRGQPNKADDGHWNPDGSKEAGRLWSEVLTSAFIETINNGISTLKHHTNDPVDLGNSGRIVEPPAPQPVSFGLSNYVTAVTVALGAFLFFSFLKLFKLLGLKKVATITIGFFAILIGGVYLAYDYFFKSKTQTT